MGAKPSGVVPDQFFGGQPSGPLHKAALGLADIDGRVQRAPDIMRDTSAKNAVLASEKIDRHLAHRRAIGEIEESPSPASLLVPVDFRRRAEPCR